ncbi:MAG: hypothetical protein SFY56_11625, partial [Bacteroidota bacterium]|nr:hypothetical protein [Bacteroidota bacterium]
RKQLGLKIFLSSFKCPMMMLDNKVCVFYDEKGTGSHRCVSQQLHSNLRLGATFSFVIVCKHLKTDNRSLKQI